MAHPEEIYFKPFHGQIFWPDLQLTNKAPVKLSSEIKILRLENIMLYSLSGFKYFVLFLALEQSFIIE